MRWEGLAAAAPELAELGRGLFDQTGLCLLGTLRRDGSPRISPCEPFIVDGDLLLGMMWRSMKARDLLRDPRLVVHSTQCDREGRTGDFKLYGRAVDVPDPEVRERYAETLETKIDWRPQEPYHLFSVDIGSAGFISFGQDRAALRWTRERPRTHPAPGRLRAWRAGCAHVSDVTSPRCRRAPTGRGSKAYRSPIAAEQAAGPKGETDERSRHRTAEMVHRSPVGVVPGGRRGAGRGGRALRFHPDRQ